MINGIFKLVLLENLLNQLLASIKPLKQSFFGVPWKVLGIYYIKMKSIFEYVCDSYLPTIMTITFIAIKYSKVGALRPVLCVVPIFWTLYSINDLNSIWIFYTMNSWVCVCSKSRHISTSFGGIFWRLDWAPLERRILIIYKSILIHMIDPWINAPLHGLYLVTAQMAMKSLLYL